MVLTHESIGSYINFGEKYASYLVVVTDKRGLVIDYKTSKDWLFENLASLRRLSVGNYMDKSCHRTYPEPIKELDMR